mgnify:CR=1 FL=1
MSANYLQTTKAHWTGRKLTLGRLGGKAGVCEITSKFRVEPDIEGVNLKN